MRKGQKMCIGWDGLRRNREVFLSGTASLEIDTLLFVCLFVDKQ